MKDLLEFVLKNLVDHPDEIQVQEEREDNKVVFKIQAHEDDKGSIIGKGGNIIKAIRDLLNSTNKLTPEKSSAYSSVYLTIVDEKDKEKAQ